MAVLTDDEKDVGVCLVDIGGGTTDIAVFTQGAIRHTAVIPIAGDQITSDIGIALRTSTPDAEEIKIRYGVALQQLADPEEMIEVPGRWRPAGRASCRARRWPASSSRASRRSSRWCRRNWCAAATSACCVPASCSPAAFGAMPGMIELGEEMFHNTVKLGVPQYDGSLRDIVRNPRYATAMGLLLEGVAQKKRGIVAHETRTFRQILARMRAWFGKTLTASRGGRRTGSGFSS